LWGIGGLGLLGYWRRRDLRRAYNPLSVRPRIERLEDRCLLTTVTNLTDHDLGSLRDAIAITPSGRVVDFQPGLNGTITLVTCEVVISKKLLILGAGSGVMTIRGNHAFRIFNVATSFKVNISGLTIADGMATNSDGGGISNSGNLTIGNSVLSNNSATGSFP